MGNNNLKAIFEWIVFYISEYLDWRHTAGSAFSSKLAGAYNQRTTYMTQLQVFEAGANDVNHAYDRFIRALTTTLNDRASTGTVKLRSYSDMIEKIHDLNDAVRQSSLYSARDRSWRLHEESFLGGRQTRLRPVSGFPNWSDIADLYPDSRPPNDPSNFAAWGGLNTGRPPRPSDPPPPPNSGRMAISIGVITIETEMGYLTPRATRSRSARQGTPEAVETLHLLTPPLQPEQPLAGETGSKRKRSPTPTPPRHTGRKKRKKSRVADYEYDYEGDWYSGDDDDEPFYVRDPSIPCEAFLTDRK